MAKTMNGEQSVDVRYKVDNHGWIAVNEKLPERKSEYTAWSPSVWCIVQDGKAQYPFVGQCNCNYGSWIDANDEQNLDEIGDVTHWQPISLPPLTGVANT